MMTQSEVDSSPLTADFNFLSHISSMLTVSDQDGVLERMIETTSRYLGAERASLLLHPDHTQHWTPFFYRRIGQNDAGPVSEPDQAPIHFAKRVMDRGLAKWVLDHKEATIVQDTQTDARWYHFADGQSQARSALCVPFIYNDDVIGVMTLLHSEAGYFTGYHQQLAVIVANQAAAAVRSGQMFAQMESQQQQLQGILYAMPDLLMVLDHHFSFVLVNEQGGTLLSRTLDADHFRDQNFAAFLGDDQLLHHIHEIISTPPEERAGHSWSFEGRSNVTQRDYMVTIALWENPTAEPGYVIVLRDITQLRDLNRFKDEMLTMASHDLRSPLALIVGYCSLIELDTPPESPIHEYLEIIQRSTERMKGLLDDLLRVEQIRNSAMEMNEQVDFEALIGQVVHNMMPSADAKQQTLDTDLSLDNLPDILLNPIFIRETMENLVNNAIKYTPAGGQIRISAHQENDRLYFAVQDNGIGIPEKDIPRLFQSFFRARQPGTENIEGRGFGLSLVKTIIERHKGQVWVESEQGKGSRFGFWLPIITAPAE